MRGMGDALMGSGFAEGENRAVIAADNAIHSPLLDDISIVGAKGILINITGGEDMTLYDVNDATQAIYDAVGENGDNGETNIIFGAVTDASMNGKIQVTVIATGFNEEKIEKKKEERNNLRLAMKMPFKKNAGEPAEQLSITLPTLQQQEEIASAPSILEPVIEPVCIEQEPAMEAAAVAEATTPLDFPSFLKRDRIKKDTHFVVSKGNIIEHYEDDMDVPTFLRKQMQ